MVAAVGKSGKGERMQGNRYPSLRVLTILSRLQINWSMHELFCLSVCLFVCLYMPVCPSDCLSVSPPARSSFPHLFSRLVGQFVVRLLGRSWNRSVGYSVKLTERVILLIKHIAGLSAIPVYLSAISGHERFLNL